MERRINTKNFFNKGQSFGCRFRGELWYEYTISYKYDSILPEKQRAQDEDAMCIINYIKWAIEDEALIRKRRRRKIAQPDYSVVCRRNPTITQTVEES